MATDTDGETTKVTMKDINEVTEQLGPDELKLLYDNLDIDPIRVKHVEASAGTTDTILKAREVLRELWLQGKGNAATREVLFAERDKILKRRPGSSGCNLDPEKLKSDREVADALVGIGNQVMFKGRTFKIVAKGRRRKLKWVYEGEAVDIKSGIRGTARKQSSQGAKEHATFALIKQLKTAGLITDEM